MSIPVSELIGRTLIAKVRVPFKGEPTDDAPALGYFPSGAVVGIIYSWLDPEPGRSGLYWQFRTQSGRFYYIAHGLNRFDLDHLVNQGVLTSAQKREAQRRADMTATGRFLEDNAAFVKDSANVLVKSLGIGVVAFLGIKALK